MRRMRLATVFAVATLVLAGCSKEDSESAPAAAAAPSLPSSAVAIATERTVQPRFTQPALVEAVQSAQIKSDVAANLLANRFTAGQLVKKGDLLVELDPAKFNAAVDGARAELMSAQANLDQVASNWQRAQKLRPDGYISELDFDQARANVDMAKAALAKAEAGLERAELNLAHTKIYAPFDGRISKPRYAVGDYVTPIAGPLFELVQLDPIYVTAKVALHVYNNFVLLRSELEERGIDVPELEIGVELSGGREYPHKGKFENWAHASADSSGMIKGRTLMPNPEGLLLPGQNVMLVGRTAREVTRIMIPQKAVMQDQQGRYVYTLDDQDTVTRTNIQVGLRDGSEWAVTDGLIEGQRVLTEGLQALRPGATLNIVED